ncbi:MAG: hypothetical protein UY22_C0014G0001 [Candidatus Amesbacteria bacterium GW2011_GWC1_48_10]|uniref:Uncharacterized protein n=1 Tax=Candidatus Amesbacteria bacterium GW2011_GWC1_48_10 TaxID=1618365 RepID=A0A0G1XJ58_9BACT|nr:MAG: hypothetical protein UY22_C0014G0001 [Candidatus Amesbacteria bacterium GW2011_GWC1_48_10]
MDKGKKLNVSGGFKKGQLPEWLKDVEPNRITFLDFRRLWFPKEEGRGGKERK